MARKKLARINVIEENNTRVFVLSQSVKGLPLYQKAKTTTTFVRRETKVLETAIDVYLRNFLRKEGVHIADGTKDALTNAFKELSIKGIRIIIKDPYLHLKNEKIVGESPNKMTVIEESGILSCAIEITIERK